MSSISIPVSPGELLDKLQILKIKLEKIKDKEKLNNIKYEHDTLDIYWQEFLLLYNRAPSQETIEDLRKANLEIWEAEEIVRQCEREKDFTEKFISSARTIYFSNDRRAARKRDINALYNATIIEEKSHSRY